LLLIFAFTLSRESTQVLIKMTEASALTLCSVLDVVGAGSYSEQVISAGDNVEELVTRILTHDLLSDTAKLIALPSHLNALVALVLVVYVELHTH
jgi:hypothetical protein